MGNLGQAFSGLTVFVREAKRSNARCLEPGSHDCGDASPDESGRFSATLAAKTGIANETEPHNTSIARYLAAAAPPANRESFTMITFWWSTLPNHMLLYTKLL